MSESFSISLLHLQPADSGTTNGDAPVRAKKWQKPA